MTSKWNISMATPAGAIAAVLDFEENGAELTGTLTDQNAVNEISEGKVENGTYTFKATLQGPTGPTKVTFTLKPDGESISGKIKMGFISLKVTGTRG